MMAAAMARRLGDTHLSCSLAHLLWADVEREGGLTASLTLRGGLARPQDREAEPCQAPTLHLEFDRDQKTGLGRVGGPTTKLLCS